MTHLAAVLLDRVPTRPTISVSDTPNTSQLDQRLVLDLRGTKVTVAGLEHVRGLVAPADNAAEAAVVERNEVIPVVSLAQAVG